MCRKSVSVSGLCGGPRPARWVCRGFCCPLLVCVGVASRGVYDIPLPLLLWLLLFCYD